MLQAGTFVKCLQKLWRRRDWEALLRPSRGTKTNSGNCVRVAGQCSRKWVAVDNVESLRKAAGARKMPAKACNEVEEEVHEFTVGEERSSDVAITLRKMNTRVKGGGHVPQTQLLTIEEQAKEDEFCCHADKLVLDYGLLNTPTSTTTLGVTKNIRMCDDCHSSTKNYVTIVVRDGHKVHRFQNGACSCKDRP